jgi:5,10-methylenetetrahydromethanopterin reductase
VTVPATGVWFFPDRPAGMLVDAIVHAERSGLDEVWVGDEGPAREPFSILAGAAVVTDRIRLAVGITNPYVRHPGVAVTTAATIAELASGRTTLGVGAGGVMSLEPFAIEAEQPVARVREFVEMARSMRRGSPCSGYRPVDLAVAPIAPAVPVFVGARGRRLNTLASEVADGAFVAGLPPFRFEEVIGWVRSVRDVDVALYPSVAFDEDARERHRPEMIWSLLDAPPDVVDGFGLDRDAVAAAAGALRAGDRTAASTLVGDDLLDQLMLLGSPDVVGRRLADLVRTHRPTSIGLAIIADDLHGSIDRAAAAFHHMRAELDGVG